MKLKVIQNLRKQSRDGVEFSLKVLRELNLYFTSDAFEEDLDEVINLIHIHNEASKPDFDAFTDRRERVSKKSKFVKNQGVQFVKLAAALGGEIGLKLGGLKGAAEGIVIGTATGAVIITVVAGHVIVKRLNKGNDGSITVRAIKTHSP